MRIGEVIRKWRTSSNRTLADVAKEIKISLSTLGKLETGEVYPDGRTLARCVNWLMTDTDIEPETKTKKGK